MGIDLITEVLFHAPPDLTAAERTLLIAIAEEARDETRRAYPGREALLHRTGLGLTGLSRAFGRLAGRGLEVRVAQGKDSNGNPVYAYRGRQSQYQLPKLCPHLRHDRGGRCRAEAGGSSLTPVDEGAVTEAAVVEQSHGERVASRPAIVEERVAPEPSISEERVALRPPIEGKRVAPGPSNVGERVAPRPERVAPRPPHPLISPQESKSTTAQATLTTPEAVATTTGKSWDRTNRQDRSTNAPAPRQPVLFPKTAVRLPEAPQVVYDWLTANGYTTLTADDAKTIHRAVAKKYPGKVTVAYLRTMAANDSFIPFADELRQAKGRHTEELIKQLVETKPQCPHGTPAGAEPHPAHGQALCVMCRRGLPAVEPKHQTHPDVAAAMTQYRQAYNGQLLTTELISLTQQADALRAEGATTEQLTALAAVAAAAGEGFIAAARRKDT